MDAFRIKPVGLKRWVKQWRLSMGIVTLAARRANIAVLVIALNLLGDGLRDIFDPRLKDN